MKPIQLTMQAFGPYKHEQVIDFRELNGILLYAVTGNTGAGKTTIFDGIAFALYGQASGEDRKEHHSLRSDFADDKTYTRVELLFETNGKTYRVLRQLPHVKVGNKTATGEDYAFMEVLANGDEVKACEKQKSKDITKKIEEILGLSYEQFNQIVMLPQGEFRKLLTSDTANKESILRKIFKTERYTDIARRLENKKKLAEDDLKEARTIRNSYIDQISGALPPRTSMLFDLLESEANIYQIAEGLKEEQNYYEHKLTQDEKVYNEAHQLYTTSQRELTNIIKRNERLQTLRKKTQELDEKRQQKTMYDAMKQQAEQANIALQIAQVFDAVQVVEKEKVQQQQHCEQLKIQVTQAEQQLQLATKQLELEQQTELERKRLEQLVHDLSKALPLFATIDQLQHSLQQSQLHLDKQQTTFNAYTIQLQQHHDKLAQLSTVEEQLDNELQQLPNLLIQQQKLQQQLQIITKFENAVTKLEQEELKLNQQQQLLDQAELTYKNLEQGWLSNQALELAALLVEGDPCPVCGSVAHVKEHVIEQAAEVDKATLAAQKHVYEQTRSNFYAQQASFKAAKTIVEDFTLQLQQEAIMAKDKVLYEQQALQLKGTVEQLQQKNSTLQNMKQERKQLTEQIKLLQDQKEQLNSSMQQLKLSIEANKVELEQVQKQIPDEYESTQALQAAITVHKTKYTALQQAFEQSQHTLDTAKTKSTQLLEASSLAQQLLQQLEQKLKQQQEKWALALQTSPFATVEQFTAAIKTRQQIAKLQQDYLSFTNDYYALQQFVETEAKELENVQLQDVEQLQQQLEQLKVSYEQAFNVVAQTKKHVETCVQYIEKLAAIAQKIVQLEEVSGRIVNLYKVLSGDNAKKVSFERYVQIGFLEQITDAANLRLDNLSNGQFQLVTTDRQLKYGAKSGLSLDVYDSYTGQTRDVKSLSGGEKFNASLCLALGMADVIQSFQGNVRIDTMFIDEGFGSLDEESLMRAIDTLIDLQNSGRMIGVISHVEELKKAMPAVLQVMKLKEGYSKAQFIIK